MQPIGTASRTSTKIQHIQAVIKGISLVMMIVIQAQ